MRAIDSGCEDRVQARNDCGPISALRHPISSVATNNFMAGPESTFGARCNAPLPKNGTWMTARRAFWSTGSIRPPLFAEWIILQIFRLQYLDAGGRDRQLVFPGLSQELVNRSGALGANAPAHFSDRTSVRADLHSVKPMLWANSMEAGLASSLRFQSGAPILSLV